MVGKPLSVNRTELVNRFPQDDSLRARMYGDIYDDVYKRLLLYKDEHPLPSYLVPTVDMPEEQLSALHGGPAVSIETQDMRPDLEQEQLQLLHRDRGLMMEERVAV